MKRVHDISAASADARVDEPLTEDNTSITTVDKDKNYRKIPTNAKKPRFNKTKDNRRGGAAYTKIQPTTSLQIVPRRKVFPIFTSNTGCETLSRQVFQTIRAKDFRLAQNLDHHQLAYVTTIAYLNRVVQCSLKHGYAFPESASRLKQVATGIQLPTVLAKYIESIGSFETLSGCTVVPHCVPYNQLQDSRLMIDPAEILEAANREVPPGDWALDVEWIVSYNDATTRAGRSGMNFRAVDNTTLVGTSEMLVSYTVLNDMLLPKAPQVMSEAEAQLGAAYRFRDYHDRINWPGENQELLFDAFTAIPFDPRVLISDVCVAAFQGGFVSKA